MTRGYDIVIVGAGSAGCVLAARLSEDPDRSVCLIEAGGEVTDPRVADPAQWPALQGTAIDWAYSTVPQAGTAGRVHAWPRGRVVGGSSCLHAMAHVRGHPSDFDAWARAGGDGWSFDSLLPFFRRSEHFSGGASDLHGADGPLDVVLPPRVHPVAQAFMEAAEEIGLTPSGDHNGPRMEGPAPNSLTIRDGRRVSLADAYLTPVLARQNLTLVTGAVVDRVSFHGGRATGVEIVRDGGRAVVGADRVVLAAGAVASPLVLMRSGIGPPEDLARAGVPCRVELPGVGANLHDHLLAAGNLYRARHPVPPSELQHSESLLYAAHGGGPAPGVVVACVVLPVVSEVLEAPPVGTAFTLMCGFTHPESRGRLLLGGPDPLDAPIIDPAYLSSPPDRAAFRASLALAREVARAHALDPWRAEELLPGPPVREEHDLDDFLARAATTHHHPVGTCSMGPDAAEAVVDHALRVHGAEGLWVVDASVIPSITTGPINASVVAIAERAADLLALDDVARG